jgi:ABC-2 type transport system ATP-binding protein
MPIISVQHLKKFYQVHKKQPGLAGSVKSLFYRKYEDVKAVDDISFTIEEGELIGFIGPNGAGKTTTLKVLSGLLYPTSGDGFVPWERKTEFQKQFSLVMGQKNQLWWDLPAIESFNLNKEIYEVPSQQYQQTLDDLVEMLEMKDLLNVQVRKLSLGQRMKAELIAALLHRPRVLFLDEPTIGLDVVMQQKMREFIKEYNQKYGATIILTSHYMGDIKELCQRVIMIDHGHLGFDGPLQQIIEKYATHKHLKVVFSSDKTVTQEQLEEIGQVKKMEWPRVELEVPRGETSPRAARLLSDFSVADLTIEDTPIEEIVRNVFKNSVS